MIVFTYLNIILLIYSLGVFMCKERQNSFFLKRKLSNLKKLNIDRMIHGLKPLTMNESSWDDRKSPTFDRVKKRNQMLKSWIGYLEVKKEEELFLKNIGIMKVKPPKVIDSKKTYNRKKAKGEKYE